MRPARVAVLFDICCVLAFVVIGRASHARGETLGGIASTAWPFLAGLGLGWLSARAWRRPLALSPAGIGAWLGTVIFGMLLRVMAGQGTALAFLGVALAFLGLFLLGWRLLWRLAVRYAEARTGEARRPSAPPGLPASKPRLTLAISASS